MLTLKNIAVIGSSGGIGKAFVDVLSRQYSTANLYPFSRTGEYRIDYESEDSIVEAANIASNTVEQILDVLASLTFFQSGKCFFGMEKRSYYE